MEFYGAETPPRNPPDLPAGKSAPYAPLRTGFPSPRLGHTMILCRPGCNYVIRSLSSTPMFSSISIGLLSSLLSIHRRRNSIRSIYLVAGSIWGTGVKTPHGVLGYIKEKML